MSVLKRLPDYVEQGKIKSWLYVIADGKINEFFRSEGRRQRRMSAYSHMRDGESEAYLPDEVVRRSEATRLVQSFVDSLPAPLREVFLLRAVEGFSGVDAAMLLEINVNTLYSREATARRRFEAFIQRSSLSEVSPHER